MRRRNDRNKGRYYNKTVSRSSLSEDVYYITNFNETGKYNQRDGDHHHQTRERKRNCNFYLQGTSTTLLSDLDRFQDGDSSPPSPASHG